MANAADPAARPGAGSTALDDDPFAGEDELWADEDWADWAATDDDSWLRFSNGLMVALVLSALGWLAVAGSVFLAYRLIA